MPSPQRPSPDATPSLLPDSRSADSSGQTTAMPPAGLHTEQADRQPLVASGAPFHADQTSSTAAPGLNLDWTTEIRSTVDPIWPNYALPITEIPSCTARDLGDRLGRLAQVQWAANADVMYAVQPRDWSRTMRMPQGSSPIWMILIRSRWLVIETLAGHLELWDIEGGGHWDGVLASFKTLVGSVDGAVVVEKAGEPAELFISTTGYRVYCFLLDLPYRGQDQSDTYTLAPHDTIFGFSGLKHKRDGWWAFARSEGSNNQGFLFVPHANTPLVRLACANQVAENQNVLDILLRDDIIVVARNRTIDLYSMSDALKLLSTDLSSTSLPFIRIEESFSIPTCDFLHHTRLLRRAPACVRPANSGIFCSSFAHYGWILSRIGKNDTRGSTAPSSRYSLSEVKHVADASAPLMLSWGESGSRMIEVGRYTLNMYFANPRRTHRSEGGSPDLMAQWEVPRDIEDVPRCAVFDEATGIAVVGMHSGMLLVADAGSWVPPMPAPGDNSDSAEGSDISQSGWSTRGIHPSPKRWPGISSNPAIFYPKALSISEYPPQIATGWFTDLEAFYPFANHPDYYGSIPWMVRELAGIPSGSRCIIFSSMHIYPEFQSNNAIIEVDVEVGNGGNLLRLAWSGEELLDFGLYQLRPDVTKEMVIQEIKKGGFPGRFCDDQSWRQDWRQNPLCFGQLVVWLFPHGDAGEENRLREYDLVSPPHV